MNRPNLSVLVAVWMHGARGVKNKRRALARHLLNIRAGWDAETALGFLAKLRQKCAYPVKA